MSPQTWVVAFLLGGVVVVGWPVGLARRRWAMRTPIGAEPSASGHPSRWDWARWDWARRWDRARCRSAMATARVIARRRPSRTIALAAGVAALCGWPAGGPVAATVCGAYVGLATRWALRRAATRDRVTSRARTLDGLGALAADLRAGLAPGTDPRLVIAAGAADSVSGSPAAASRSDERLLALTVAAWRLAERTGAPVADLVDRIEADARAADRGHASAAAQAAGARATALLLAGLPVGGIALGYAIGVDPLRVLLHTPLGAGCAVGTLVLQFAGLAWADRLAGAGARS